MPPQKFIILGGGISGLSAAWYLTKLIPSAYVTLVEKNNRLGGWVHTKRQDGQLFELGPRTLRPAGEAGKVVLDMIHQLNLNSDLLTISKTSPAAINRYIYKDSTLHHLPTSPLEFLTPWKSKSPLLKGLLFSLLREPFQPPSKESDESIHAFVTRRFGKPLADNLVSAVVHGIYAGDAKQLSVRSAMPFLWEAEKRHGSVGRAVMAPASASTKCRTGNENVLKIDDEQERQFIHQVQQESSIFSFKDGMQTLTDALKRALEKGANVEIVRGEVEKVEFDGWVKVKHSGSAQPLEADHIVSAIPASSLAPLLPNQQISSLLSSIKAVDVAIANIAFAGDTVLPVNGFGYLIPFTESTPVLGTVFDSCAMPDQDVDVRTRVTVMMGGHRFQKYFGDAASVSKDLICDTAMHALRTHLGIKDAPIAFNVAVHRQCIPQYTVGHYDKLTSLHRSIKNTYAGKLSVVGASYWGVGVNDCVKGARDLVTGLATPRRTTVTGLERVERE